MTSLHSNSECLVRGYPSVGGDCGFAWGEGGGYCGTFSDDNPHRWVDTCDGLDALVFPEGCSVEARTADGRQFTYASSVSLCGGNNGCETRETPGCDSVNSIRIFATPGGRYDIATGEFCNITLP